MKKKETKDIQMGVRLTPALRIKVDRLCRKYKLNISNMIAKLIEEAK